MKIEKGNRLVDAEVESPTAKLYNPEFESQLLRGVEKKPRPWDLQGEIAKRTKTTDRLLDIGCGTATKILSIAHRVAEVVGLEPSPPMRERAQEHIASTDLDNVHIVAGYAEHLPFNDDSFDVVTNMLAPDDVNEIYRVLKPGGYAILEKLGETDKRELKSFFGSDEKGPRGQLSDLHPGERLHEYGQKYAHQFKEVITRGGKWVTYYSPEGLELLLCNTPTIRDFDPTDDEVALREAVAELITPDGIALTQHRILIIARK